MILFTGHVSYIINYDNSVGVVIVTTEKLSNRENEKIILWISFYHYSKAAAKVAKFLKVCRCEQLRYNSHLSYCYKQVGYNVTSKLPVTFIICFIFANTGTTKLIRTSTRSTSEILNNFQNLVPGQTWELCLSVPQAEL